ncbi:MAG: hypothetical protein LQ338_006451 [Usnochroma carphineum]|nr:MAG: hypothetical protein LQ338_006451 [Usnochroma carphineum]
MSTSNQAKTHDMVTRFKGTKTPFMGVKLEGTPAANPRTPTEKRTSRVTKTSSRRSGAPSPEAAPEKSRDGNKAAKCRKKFNGWNKNFSFNQPAGTGRGLTEEEDPDPLYKVKRINCRYKVPGTNLVAWTGDPSGKTTYWRPGFEPWNWKTVKQDLTTGYGIADL